MAKTAVFKNSSKEISPYFPMYNGIMSAKAYTCLATGEDKKFPIEWRVLWCYSLDRYQFFKENNKDWFDNQSDIADACGVSENTAQRFLKAMATAGYIQTTTTRISGHKSNSYVITQDLVLRTEKPKSQPKLFNAADKTKPAANTVIEESAPWNSESIPLSAYERFEPVSVQDTEDELNLPF